MITPASILSAVDSRRNKIAGARGSTVPYSEVADAIELHPAIFSRLKKENATLPSAESIAKIAAWIGDEKELHCKTCPEESMDMDEKTEDIKQDGVFAIQATGVLSDSDDPETKAAVGRVKELLKEGAVGVSVKMDLHPDDAAIIADAEKKMEAAGGDNIVAYLPHSEWKPRQRIRHTAIVDTPAFSEAMLRLSDDGKTVYGPVTYEGIYTGDVRYAASPGNIDLEATRVPSAIVWDRTDGDHTGMTIGSLTSFERVEMEGEVSGRPILNDEAITAALQPLEMPAAYFSTTMPTTVEPIRISKPDSKGFRAIRGLAAPKGVCHRSAMTCFQYPADPDKTHRHFHTGSLLRLDNGSDIRVGAVTLGGSHLDPALTKAGVQVSAVNSHRDNANRIFALVRVWETRFGLMLAGVIPPDVKDADVMRALACSPSVELWPIGGGKRTLVGIHLVPTPAWPVMASMGDVELVVTHEPILLEEDRDKTEEVIDGVVEQSKNDYLVEKIDMLTQKVETILALMPIDDIKIE